MAIVLLGCCFGFALIALFDGRYGTAAFLIVGPALLTVASQLKG